MNSNNLAVITLKGPIEFSRFKEPEKVKNDYPDLEKNGIYLMVIRTTDEEYAVTYVGAAPQKKLFERISEWYNFTQNKNVGSYFIKDGDELEIILTYLEETEITDDVISKNINDTLIFYSTLEDSVIDNKILNRERAVEGAIKILLRKKSSSRKFYLGTENPTYQIDYRNLRFKFEDEKCHIIGLKEKE